MLTHSPENNNIQTNERREDEDFLQSKTSDSSSLNRTGSDFHLCELSKKLWLLQQEIEILSCCGELTQQQADSVSYISRTSSESLGLLEGLSLPNFCFQHQQ